MLKNLFSFLLYSCIGTSFCEAQELTIASWGGAYQASQQKAHVEPYLAQNPGVTVTWRERAPEVVAKLRAMNDAGSIPWDLVEVGAADSTRLCDDGLAMEIDFDDILSAAPDGTNATEDFGTFLINDCFIPQIVYSTVLGYRTDMIPEGADAPDSICDLFDLKTYPGNRALEKRAPKNMEWALLCDGVAEDDLYDVLSTEKGQKRAAAKLATIRDNVIWWTTGAETPQLLVDGEIFMGSTLNSRLFSTTQEQAQPIGVVWDAQFLELDGWIIPSGLSEDRLDLAQDFVRFATGTQRLADLASYISYGPARASSAPLVAKHVDLGIEMSPHMPTDPKNVGSALLFNHEFWTEYEREAQERFNSWIAGGVDGEKAKVQLMFGTTRRHQPNVEPLEQFSSTEYSELSFGTMTIFVPENHVVGDVGKEQSIIEWLFFPDYTEEFEIDTIAKLTEDRFVDMLVNSGGQSEGTAFLYIHGFATPFEYAAQRTAQLAYDLQPYRGAPIFFSWPSMGKRSRTSYQADEDMIEQNRKVLTDFLITILEQDDIKTLHLVAHSLGARLLARSLEELSYRDSAYLDKVGEVVLAAADIRVGSFVANFEQIFQKSPPRTTIYSSDDDWALYVSRLWHGNGDGAYRIGEFHDDMTLFDGIDIVDISGLKGSFDGHSVVAQNPTVLNDLRDLYANRKRPAERCCLRSSKISGRTYYRLLGR